VQVCAIDGALAAAPALFMAGNLYTGVLNTHGAVADNDADLSVRNPVHGDH